MKKSIITLVLLLLAVPAALVAQASYTQSEVVTVTSMRIQPKDAERFHAAVREVVQASEQANLSAAYGWTVWSEFFTYHIVSTEPGFSALADADERWMKQFEGTPAQAKLEAAFQRIGQIPQEGLGSSIIQVVPEWTYGMDKLTQQPTFAEVCEYSVASGMEMQFDAVYKGYVAILGKLGYPYAHIGHRYRYGGPVRHTGITLYDTKEAFFGRNDVERLVEQKGQGEAWGKLASDFLPTVTGFDCAHLQYMPELSYSPQPDSPTQ